MGNNINNNKILSSKPFGIIPSVEIVYDPDAQNYFNANTSITSTADKNAINTFFLGLKSDRIYTKIKAMYLPIWGTATNSKWNLVNPVDSNAAYRLTFSTGFTFTSGGMTPNGTSAFANTYLNTNSVFPTSNLHLSYYSRTNTNATQIEIGNLMNPAGAYCFLEIRASGITYSIICQSAAPYTQYNDPNSLGFYIGTRTGVDVTSYKNSVQKATLARPVSANPSYFAYICAANQVNVPVYYSQKQCSFASLGDDLNNTESINFSNRVNTLMTYFGINVY